MYSGSIAVFVLVSLFSSGQSTTVVAPSETVMPTSTPGGPAPTSTAGGPVPSSTTGAPTPAPTGVAPTPSSTSTAANTAGASVTAPPTTQSSMKPSCASVSFIANMTWNASLADKNSNFYKNGEIIVSMTMKYLYNDSKKYDNVNGSEVVFSEKDSLTLVKVKLCLVVKTNDGTFIEDVFKARVKTGYLHANMPVKSYGAGFEPLGVTFKDWKAKDDECDKCEGAGGEFVIVGTCEDDTYSCKGQKNTKMTTDCVKFCPDPSNADEDD
ncbi:hypothetical protein ACROYT_G012710 [Oculina patagonica]